MKELSRVSKQPPIAEDLSHEHNNDSGTNYSATQLSQVDKPSTADTTDINNAEHRKLLAEMNGGMFICAIDFIYMHEVID